MLEGIKFFEGLSDSEISNLSIFCQKKDLRPGESLFKQGDEANSMYIVKSGKIRIFKETVDSNKTLAELGQDSIIGEMAIFGKPNTRMASAEATENSTLITLLSFSINELAGKHPGIALKIENMINERIALNGNI